MRRNSRYLLRVLYRRGWKLIDYKKGPANILRIEDVRTYREVCGMLACFNTVIASMFHCRSYVVLWIVAKGSSIEHILYSHIAMLSKNGMYLCRMNKALTKVHCDDHTKSISIPDVTIWSYKNMVKPIARGLVNWHSP